MLVFGDKVQVLYSSPIYEEGFLLYLFFDGEYWSQRRSLSKASSTWYYFPLVQIFLKPFRVGDMVEREGKIATLVGRGTS